MRWIVLVALLAGCAEANPAMYVAAGLLGGRGGIQTMQSMEANRQVRQATAYPQPPPVKVAEVPQPIQISQADRDARLLLKQDWDRDGRVISRVWLGHKCGDIPENVATNMIGKIRESLIGSQGARGLNSDESLSEYNFMRSRMEAAELSYGNGACAAFTELDRARFREFIASYATRPYYFMGSYF